MLLLAFLVTQCGGSIKGIWHHRGGNATFHKKLEVGRSAPYNAVAVTPKVFKITESSSSDLERVEVDPVNGVLVWAMVNPDLVPAIEPSQALPFLEKYIRDHNALLGISPEDLKPSVHHLVFPSPQLAVLSFQRIYKNMEVRGGTVQFIFTVTRDKLWKVREIVNHGFGKINSLNKGDSELLSADLLQKTGVETLQEVNRKPVIFVRGGDNGGYEFYEASEITAQDSESGEHLTLTYANGSGELLEAFSHHQHAVEMEIGAEIYERSYVYKTLKTFPMPFVTVGGKQADEDGVVSTDSGSTAVSLSGPRGQIIDMKDNARAVYDFNIDPSQSQDPKSLVVTGGQASLAALSAYVNVNRVVETVKKYLSDQDTDFFNSKIPVQVNVTDEACNAFFDGQRIVLFAEGSAQGLNCGNMALINDVLFHEWGHGLDNSVGTQPGITDGGFSEGIGDINASFVTNDPNMGPGFVNGSTQPIRSLKNKAQHPMPQGTDVHKVGTIIAGAFWDMREGLMARYGQKEGTDMAARYFYRHLLTTDAYTDSYKAVLRLDAGDGSSERSPNYCLINKAFAGHGLAQLESNCVDEGAAILDGTLSLKVEQDEGGGRVRFLAIAPQASGVGICIGSLADCTKSGRIDIAFSPLAANSGSGPQVYRANEPYLIKGQTEMTILGLDSQKAVKGAHSVVIKSN